MLGPLTLESVRQQQHETVLLLPLVLGRNDVLVDHDLRTVDEVAELRFPHHQCIRIAVAVAVLVANRCVLRQQRVVDPEAGACAWKRVQRHPPHLVVVVDERGVPLAERAAPRVLTNEANRSAFQHK